MILEKNTFFWKAFAVLRFYICRAYFRKKISAKGISALGKNIRLLINNNGQIFFRGRVIAADDVELQSSGKLIIGSGTTINRYSRIVAYDHIEMGDNVMLAEFVTIVDHDHKFSLDNNELVFSGYETKPVKIGSNVWVGEKASILKGCTIGDNVIVAAHSLVTKDVPSNSIVGGVPAKILKVIE